MLLPWASHPVTNKSCRIQVKYRSGYWGRRGPIRLRNCLDFDFLVLVGEPEHQEFDFYRKNTNDEKELISQALHPIWVIEQSEIELTKYRKSDGWRIASPRTNENLFAWEKIVSYLE